ncbi:MAG: copper-translocating P-type ATPase [Armatimonadetes bacterium]|nr:copper-translocating P-type ATPase [Armatimonadota bacterium]
MELDMRRRFLWALALTVPAVFYSPLGEKVLHVTLPAPLPVNWILFILTTPVVVWAGNIFLTGAYASLRDRKLNMSVLVTTGVLAAYLFSVGLTLLGAGETFYEAAAMLVTFVLFGHWMEMRSRRGTSDALRALFSLVPPRARVIRDGTEIEVPTADIRVGDLVVITPGDKVPVDGEVVTGQTSIDESLVTGESLPVPKGPGDRVIGGSINGSGAVTFRATKVGNETALAQIVRLVEAAQSSKAPGQRLADRAAAYLVVLAVGAGVVTFVVWYAVLRADLLLALTFAISAVVIACPDALGLATPTAVAVGTGVGARHHILIKDAATLERISSVTAVIFDKTGTLTEGRPAITDVATASGHDANDLVRLVAAAERRANHPLALAVLAEAGRRGLSVPQDLSEFNAIAGHGVEARVDGRHLLVGTRRLMEQRGIDLGPMAESVARALEAGQTVMLAAVDGQPAGWLAAADPIRPTARTAVERLRALGIEPVMISGDNRRTAEAVARELGIERVFAEVLPQDKAAHVRRLQEEGKVVAMVGDGINDAPALAQADVGIAIGAGTDVAVETAQMVLMRSDPLDVLRGIRLSQATVTKMKQNLVWASVYNVLAIPIAAGVLHPSLGITLRPEWAALLMSASSIIVATNAVLLKRVEREMAG